jgi:hypothetical protein
MRRIDAIPGEPLDWPRMAPARFEALNDLAALNRDRAISPQTRKLTTPPTPLPAT